VHPLDESLLRELRGTLLHLHKTLLDWQRAEYELDRGVMPAMQFLQVLLNDEAFAWLRSMSGLIVQIDEALEAKEPDEIPVGPIVAEARRLVSPPAGSVYAERYHAALQELPEAVLTHGGLVTLLKMHDPPGTA